MSFLVFKSGQNAREVCCRISHVLKEKCANFPRNGWKYFFFIFWISYSKLKASYELSPMRLDSDFVIPQKSSPFVYLKFQFKKDFLKLKGPFLRFSVSTVSLWDFKIFAQNIFLTNYCFLIHKRLPMFAVLGLFLWFLVTVWH